MVANSRISRLSMLVGALLTTIAFAWWYTRPTWRARGRDPLPQNMTPERAVLADLGPIPTDGLSNEVALQDPSGHAMNALCTALTRAQQNRGQAHLVFYGGSHTASDEYTGRVREALQRRYGDSGHGFVLPVPTFPGFWQSGVEIDESTGFETVRPSSNRRRVDLYGMTGIRFDARANVRATATLRTDSTVSQVRVSFLRVLNGGELEVVIDGTSHRIATRGVNVADDVTFDVDHAREVVLHSRGVVRVFGVEFLRNRPGVRVDLLAVTGSKARHHLFWHEAMWAQMLTERTPDFISLAYGNNEAEDTHLTFDEHAVHFHQMLARIRRHFPSVSCLVIGPGYRHLQRDGHNDIAMFTDPMADVQQRAAFEQGCAFFDSRVFQGGRPGLSRWEHHFPMSWLRDDGVHWQSVAYRRFGEVLTRALVSRCEQAL